MIKLPGKKSRNLTDEDLTYPVSTSSSATGIHLLVVNVKNKRYQKPMYCLFAAAVGREGGEFDILQGSLRVSNGSQHRQGLAVYFNLFGHGLEDGVLRDVVITSLTFFLLQDKRDTTDGTTSDSLHQVGHKSGNLVSESLGRDDSDLTTDLLIGVEVEGQLRVVPLNDKTCGFFDSLGSNATLCSLD